MSSVYDRLTDPKGYTGVYAKRFEGDGRINHHTDQSMSNGKQSAPARFSNEKLRPDLRTVERRTLNTLLAPPCPPPPSAWQRLQGQHKHRNE